MKRLIRKDNPNVVIDALWVKESIVGNNKFYEVSLRDMKILPGEAHVIVGQDDWIVVDVDEDRKDLVVYYPFYGGGKYQPMPHTLASAGSYSDAKELFDFIKKCSLTEEECLERCKNLNGIDGGLIEKELKEQFTDLAETWQTPKGECYYDVSWNDLLKIANHFYNLGKGGKYEQFC